MSKKTSNTFARQAIDYYYQVDASKWKLPRDISLLDPFADKSAMGAFEAFYNKYFSDKKKRHIILGINPGRFGAGVTGISFTDPKILKEVCGIDNTWQQRYELSAIFIYEMIEAFGGVKEFYKKFFVTSVIPLGFVKDGKNINYYDDRKLQDNLKKHIVKNFEELQAMQTYRDKVFVLGQGKNMAYMQKLNDEYKFFDEVIPLPHPRWVMQYRRKEKDLHIDKYLQVLESV